jgi:hypothetical protein
MIQETSQTIGKIKFIVVTHFKKNGPDIKEKLERLMVLEIKEKTNIAHLTK